MIDEDVSLLSLERKSLRREEGADEFFAEEVEKLMLWCVLVELGCIDDVSTCGGAAAAAPL